MSQRQAKAKTSSCLQDFSHDTLGEIPPSFHVYGICHACERSELVDHLALVREQGDLTITYFRKLVRCQVCDRRTEDIRIVYVGKTGFGYRDD